jgi:methylmalonyl-CoA mutase cobalamin-binding subunit
MVVVAAVPAASDLGFEEVRQARAQMGVDAVFEPGFGVVRAAGRFRLVGVVPGCTGERIAR